MKELKFNQDEFATDKIQISKAEEIWGVEFPNDYKEFLLRSNGGEVQPSVPTIKTTNEFETWQIERFCSVGDLILQKRYQMDYTYEEQHYEEDLEPFKVNRKDLLTIAIAERGCYYINLSREQYGQMFVADYQGGDGFGKLQTTSFSEFLESLEPLPEYNFLKFEKTRKIYDSRFYQTPNSPELGIQRFKEVLSYIGDANSKSIETDWTVIQYYAYVSPYDKMGNFIFDYLLENGGKTDGLLLRTRNIETIKLLIDKYGLDYNQAYNGLFPILNIVGSNTWNGVKENYELLDKLLNSNIELDLTIKNSDGINAKTLLKEMVVEYEKYREYDKNHKKMYPEMHNFITSDKINSIIEGS